MRPFLTAVRGSRTTMQEYIKVEKKRVHPSPQESLRRSNSEKKISGTIKAINATTTKTEKKKINACTKFKKTNLYLFI